MRSYRNESRLALLLKTSLNVTIKSLGVAPALVVIGGNIINL